MGDGKVNLINSDLKNFIIDIDLSDEISGFLMTVYTCLRKEENDKPGHMRFLEYTTKIDEVDISVRSVVEKIKAQKIEINFLICSPIVELITLFRSFYDKVRTGVTRLKFGKFVPATKKQENTQNIFQYGLTNQHIALLQGVTLAPERRTGVLRSLGPLTQATLFIMEDKFFDKLKSAMSYILQMLPLASEIIAACMEANHPGNVSGVMKELGDTLLLTTARSTQKIYFPLLMFLVFWQNEGNLQCSLSGAPMLKFYTDFITRTELKLKMRSGADPLKTSEVVFHAMFGTNLQKLEHPRTNKQNGIKGKR